MNRIGEQVIQIDFEGWMLDDVVVEIASLRSQ